MRVLLSGLALAVGLALPAATPAAVAARCPTAVGSVAAAERGVGDVAVALPRLVPRVYADMTNQSGGGAWRGYIVLGLISLGPDRVQTLGRRYRSRAERACGARVADRSWVALITFPNAGSARFGGSVAYLAPTRRGWIIWRTEVVRAS
jgi:hypothetical protein